VDLLLVDGWGALHAPKTPRAKSDARSLQGAVHHSIVAVNFKRLRFETLVPRVVVVLYLEHSKAGVQCFVIVVTANSVQLQVSMFASVC
jgi:hypothetical protein